MWIADFKKDIAMSCIPKNGSTSMRNCLTSDRIYENHEILDISTRVAWIRNPIDRLISAYSFFYYLNERDGNGQQTPNKKQTASWESFADHFLNTPNRHWDKQKEMLSINGCYVPTISHKFEDVMPLWSNYLPGLLPWQNACTRLPINDYRRDEINSFYAEDLELWFGL